MVVRRHQDICRLDVAVDDALLMRIGECFAELNDILDRLAQRQPAGGDPIAQRSALNIAHDQEGRAILLADIVDRQDCGVLQPSDRVRFALEARVQLRIAREIGTDNLDRHKAVGARLIGLVDGRHATAADHFEQIIGAKIPSCELTHSDLLGYGLRCDHHIVQHTHMKRGV